MSSDDDRAAFRAFVQANHPDHGGDPETFRAGLAAFRHRTGGSERAGSNVVFHRRRRGVAALRGWWTDRHGGASARVS
ncbi:MAG: hypothetical protein NVSMB13_15850 [Mycobacteriales bacterium]